MSNKPFMKLWVGDYMRDTRHLSTLEHGAYLLLIMEAWQRPSGAIPNDEELIARLAGLSLKEWDKISHKILALFKLNKRSNHWVHKRVKKEHQKIKEIRKVRQDASLTYWNKKKKDDANAYQMKSKRYPSHSHSQKDKKQVKNDKKILGVDWSPSADIKSWAKSHSLSDRDIAIGAEGFVEYWTAGKGANTKRENWDLSFKSWMRKNKNYSPEEIKKSKSEEVDIWDKRLNYFKKHGEWMLSWGVPPDQDGHSIPREALDRHGFLDDGKK